MPRVEPRVTLLRATPGSEGLVASAGRLCYAADTTQLFENDGAKDASLIEFLKNAGHLSPIEHASFTFYLEGVSRALTHQLVRHRLASYSQRSQRYVAHDAFDYIAPPQLTGKYVATDDGPVDAATYYDETMALIAQRYAALNDALGRAGEASNEDARYVLPNACESKVVVTMNARALLHFFEERLCGRAQWEIRAVAGQMLTLARAACPAIFQGAGPKCVRLGACPEGPRTCGRLSEMRRQYGTP